MADIRNKIGPYHPCGSLQRGVYIGADHNLKGKEALIGRAFGDHLVAQFDDVKTGYGYGWHQFHDADFRKDPQ